MLRDVGSDGKRMPPYWFPLGLKIGQNKYLDVLKAVLKLWIDANYKNVDYAWQQDSAPGHKVKKTQGLCPGAVFVVNSDVAQNSPDLTPLDYRIWGFVESRACAKLNSNVASVKKEWTLTSEEFVKNTCAASGHGLRR